MHPDVRQISTLDVFPLILFKNKRREATLIIPHSIQIARVRNLQNPSGLALVFHTRTISDREQIRSSPVRTKSNRSSLSLADELSLSVATSRASRASDNERLAYFRYLHTNLKLSLRQPQSQLSKSHKEVSKQSWGT